MTNIELIDKLVKLNNSVFDMYGHGSWVNVIVDKDSGLAYVANEEELTVMTQDEIIESLFEEHR